MAKCDYDNWLISLEADNFSSFIKVWFAYLATVHEIVSKSVDANKRRLLLKDMRGDGEFLKKYRESHLPQININESTKSAITECYKISKTHIKNVYPEYYFVTYYKQIEDNILYTNQPSTIAKDNFVFKVKIEKNHLYIGVLIDEAAPINAFLKNRYIDTKISLEPNTKNLDILDDEEKFYRYIWENCRPIFKSIKSKKESNDYEKISGSLSLIFQFVINTARHELDLYNFIYREKFRESPTESEAKEWFYEFSYNLRNVLFHRVVDPFDKNWTNIVKYASQALYDIVVLNIEKLKTM